jgi:hypothetical protein
MKFNAVINPADRQKQIDDFVKNYMNIDAQGGGVAATDPRYDLAQVKAENYVPNAAMMDRAKERIFSYFGVNESIIQSKFNDEQWNAYLENTIKPIALQLSEEFTYKLLTRRERDGGNSILFETNILNTATINSRIRAARFLVDIGAATLDQIMTIFDLPPIGGDEGSRRVQTLNMINTDIVDEYQLEGVKE